MSLSIYFPRASESLLDTTDIGSFLHLIDLPSRKVVFFGELMVGYIHYTTSEDTNIAEEVKLKISIFPGGLIENNTLSFSEEDEQCNEEHKSNHFNIVDTTLSESNMIMKNVDELSGNTHRVWKFEIPVTYPRHKIIDPTILVSSSIELREELHSDDSKDLTLSSIQDTILEDYEPGFSNNLFSELNNSISATDSKTKRYQLSNSIFKIPSNNEKPVNIVDTTSGSINVLKSTLKVPVSPSLVIRLKSTKPAGRNNILLATLNIESSEELLDLLNERKAKIYFNILDLRVEFKSGAIEKFSPTKFPICYKSSDSLSIIYKIINNDFLHKELSKFESSNYQLSKLLDIKLTLQIQKFNSSTNAFENLSNIITTNWSPYVDFSIIAPPINNSLKTSTYYSPSQVQPANSLQSNKIMTTRKSALMNSVYQSKAPVAFNSMSNSIVSLPNPSLSSGFIKKTAKPLSSVSSSSVTVNLTTNNNSVLSGLRLTFKGKINIKVGKVVKWKLQAINDSPNKLSLSLIVQCPLRQTPSASSNNISSSNLLSSDDSDSKAILVYNKSQLQSLYNNLKSNGDGILILNNSIRIGPLETNSVFETEISLLGISRGIFNLDGIKIFDINSGDGLDFGKLVEVFVT